MPSTNAKTSARTLAAAVAAGRLMIGTGLILSPRAAARSWIGDDVTTEGARVFARAIGGRDLALAAGVLSALKRGGDAATWVRLSIIADTADFAATAAIRPRGTRAGLAVLYVLAGGAVALSSWAQAHLD